MWSFGGLTLCGEIQIRRRALVWPVMIVGDVAGRPINRMGGLDPSRMLRGTSEDREGRIAQPEHLNSVQSLRLPADRIEPALSLVSFPIAFANHCFALEARHRCVDP